MGHEVQQTRWDRIVRRVSGSIGPGSRVSETLTELMPVLDIERVPAELFALGGTHIAQGFSVENGVAANFQQSMLLNPVNSNALITLTSISVFSDFDQSFDLGVTQNVFTNNNPTNVAFTDGRLFAASVPVGQVRDGISLVRGVSFYNLRANTTESQFYQPPDAVAVLSPGTAYSVGASVVNTLILVAYTWRERPAEESELNL